MKTYKLIMKKKLVILLFALIMPTMILSGCKCNQACMDTNLYFEKALVYENGVWNEYKITRWDDYSNDMLCIWTTDGQMIYSSANNIILYGNE